MPSEKTLKSIIIGLIIIIFLSFLIAVVLFILSGDNWFTASVQPGTASMEELLAIANRLNDLTEVI